MSDEDSISLGDNPFGTWASNDDLQGFQDAPSTDNEPRTSRLNFEPEPQDYPKSPAASLSIAQGNASFKDEGHISFLNFEPEHLTDADNPLNTSEESLSFQDAFSVSTSTEPPFLNGEPERQRDAKDFLIASDYSLTFQEAFSVALGNASLKQTDDRNKTISFSQTLSTTLGEEAKENSNSEVDIFSMEPNQPFPSWSQSMKETSITDDDDSSFSPTVDEETNDIEDPDKEIKSKLFYFLGGMGLFYVIGLIASCLCKVCGKGNNNDMDAAGIDIANGAETVSDSVHLSMSASKSQLGLVAAAESGATTTVNSTVVANMAISAASNTAMSAASAAGGMATVAATGGAVAAAATGVTVGTMTTVATVATAAVAVGSGVLTGQNITLVQQFGCAGSGNIVEESLGRMKIGFRNQDLPSRTDLEDLFVFAYNTVSPGCLETFQRGAISASLDSSTVNDFGVVETMWTATVSCSPYCPPEPLFGKTLEGQDDRRQLQDVKEFLSFFEFSEYLDDSYYNSSVFMNDQCETNATDCSVENTRDDTHIVFVQILNASAIDSDSDEDGDTDEDGDSGEAIYEVLETYYLNGDDIPSESPTADSISAEPTVSLVPTQEPTTAYPTFNPTVATMAPITAAPSPAPTAEPSKGPTMAPITAAPSPAPTAEPSKGPTGYPTSSSAPSLPTATRAPTGSPSVSPSADPSPQASEPPTIQPSSAPTGIPTGSPSVSPSADPSPPPTIQTSGAPTGIPTAAPTESPTGVPSAGPSIELSVTPTIEGSSGPSAAPSSSPTGVYSTLPSGDGSSAPSVASSNSPTGEASSRPSVQASSSPSVAGSSKPSAASSNSPTGQASSRPSVQASSSPSVAAPSNSPTGEASSRPSVQASSSPSVAASSKPSAAPSNSPTSEASSRPSVQASSSPSVAASSKPSAAPSNSPTDSSPRPSASPSVTQPSSSPSVEKECCNIRSFELWCMLTIGCGDAGCEWYSNESPSCIASQPLE